MPPAYDAVVIGAGFAGAATAYHLSRLGEFRILILERETEPGRHASGKNAALLRQAVSDARVGAMVQETLRALESPPQDWERKNIFRRTGSVLLGENRVLKGFAGLLQKLGAAFELRGREDFPETLDAELRAELRAADYEALLFTPGDGVVDVAALLANYLDAARSRGATLRCGAEVRGLSREAEEWRVTTGAAEFRARLVINAAGPWAGGLGVAAGLPDRGFAHFRRHLFLAAAALQKPDQPYLWDTAHEFYFRPDPQGLLLCAGDEESHPAREPAVDPSVEAWLFAKLRAHFPALAPPEIRRAWACLRSFLPGSPFLIEAEAGAPSFLWVAGLGGHGMGSSFGAGRSAAERAVAFLNRQAP